MLRPTSFPIDDREGKKAETDHFQNVEMVHSKHDLDHF